MVTFFSLTNDQDSFSEFVEIYTPDSVDLDLSDPTPASVMELLAVDIALSGEYGDVIFLEEGVDGVDGEDAYGVALQGTVDETTYAMVDSFSWAN